MLVIGYIIKHSWPMQSKGYFLCTTQKTVMQIGSGLTRYSIACGFYFIKPDTK